MNKTLRYVLASSVILVFAFCFFAEEGAGGVSQPLLSSSLQGTLYYVDAESLTLQVATFPSPKPARFSKEDSGLPDFLSPSIGGLVGLYINHQVKEARLEKIDLRFAVGCIAVDDYGSRVLLSMPYRGDPNAIQFPTKGALLLDKDGKKIKKLPFAGRDPQVIAGGKEVVLSSGRMNERRIKRFSLETGEQLPLEIDSKFQQFWPRFSPDLQRLVFLEGAESAPQLHVYDISSKTRRLLVDVGSKPCHPSWAPDGKSVYFASLADSQIHKINLDDGSDQALTTDDFQKLFPTASPDGRFLLYLKANTPRSKGSFGGRFHLQLLDQISGKCDDIKLNCSKDIYSIWSPVWSKAAVSAP